MKRLKIASYYTPEADEIAKDDTRPRFHFSGVYLHGDIERKCGYDICYPTNPEDFPGCVKNVTHKFDDGEGGHYFKTYPYLFLDGIFPCRVDGKYDCTAFLWYDKDAVEAGYDYANMQRGLIVSNYDDESLVYAKKQYSERARCLQSAKPHNAWGQFIYNPPKTIQNEDTRNHTR